MSSTVTSTQCRFGALFDVALAKYAKRTGQDLRNHPLAASIDKCQSPDALLSIFQMQSRAFDEFRNGDPKLIKWLKPVVDGLHIVSARVNASASLGFPPASLIFSGIGILLSTAKYVRESYDALVDIFECIENFSNRLKIYVEIRPTSAMTETVIKIMVEILAVLALATKQINQGKLKKYARKLLGEKDIESILQRLDRLTVDESKFAAAQTLDVVCGLVKNMAIVMEDGKTSTNEIRETLVQLQELAMSVNKMNRERLEESVRRWLPAPDPWTNHNIARKAHHQGTALWFTQGDTFGKWKSTAQLLWIHGLPGSGKTVLSSSIIESLYDLGMRETGLATICFFYFDFRDGGKQNVRHLLSSILIQLCNQSNKFSDALSTFFMAHGHGSRQPSEGALMECLTDILRLPGRGTLYLIIDALDECPNSSGYPTPREQVLDVIQAIIKLQLSRLHLCVTSRPETNIRDVLEPLAIHNVPLHKQAGQNRDIFKYVNHFVCTEPRVRRWQEEDKQLVIETLTEKAGGMFRWVQCQMETLRRCFPPSIRQILSELPRTLDETYERILLKIDEEKRAYAHRLFQWLVVSIRPLRVEELAELFAVLPGAESKSGFNIGWRPEDPEEFILSACSTLVAIVDVRGRKVAQFSHFSAREYLTSDRIANSAHVSHFHIHLKSAHTVLARTCLNALLQLDYSIDKTKIQSFPLAWYAAEHWVDHARYEGVSSDIQYEMDCLFDRKRPHFAAWNWLHNVDGSQNRYLLSTCTTWPDAGPLYCSALCGFRDLAERLLTAYPHDANARGGHHETALYAAFINGYLDIVLLLLERGADAEFRGRHSQTLLYMASSRGYAEVVRSLIDHRADLNSVCDDIEGICTNVKRTPLLVASRNDRQEVARVLLGHSADVNYQDNFGRSPLHLVLCHPSNNLVRLLLDHNANPNALDIWGNTALHDASSYGHTITVMLLFEYGAHVDAQNKRGWTPLHEAAREGHLEVVQVLLDHGAESNTQKIDGWTPLHLAAYYGYFQVVDILLKRGADPDSRTGEGKTPFQLSLVCNHTRIAQMLSECTGPGNEMDVEIGLTE